jgi:glycerol-3-phosphate O-acyltransferase
LWRLRLIGYRLSRAFVRWLARPTCAGTPAADIAPNCVYVLPLRAVSDLIVLDLIAQSNDLPAPLGALKSGDRHEARRFVFLNRPTGFMRRNTMITYSDRLVRLLDDPQLADSTSVLQPVQIFWGRSRHRDHTLTRTLLSEDWAATSRLKRFLNLLLSRRHIVVHFGESLPLASLAATYANRRIRKAARLLRVQFRNQKVARLGPDYSHRRTLVDQVVASRAVQDIITAAEPAERTKLNKSARKAALTIASHMSYPTIRVLESLLTWFWNHIYDGVDVSGFDQVRRIAQTHTLVYVPSHRSHVDYLLLSYLLFHNGLMIPHIAAGDNLNLPVLGPILRRGGAFFMHRSFRDDPLYAAVFAEYLYQVYRRGHSVEFFLEGGRTRTGRLLPARTGLLKMTLQHSARGLPRPIAFVPVYLGHEKLIEAGSYLDELRGGEKKGESIGDVFRGLRLVRQNFGRVKVNFAEPIDLEAWRARGETNVSHLGNEVLQRINASASVNPINLVALVLLGTPRLAIEEHALTSQIRTYQSLIGLGAAAGVDVCDLDAEAVVEYVLDKGMLTREHESFGDVLTLDPFSAVLMTWYRNNVAHVLALPSLIACLLVSRSRPLAVASLERMVSIVFPYMASELHTTFDPQDTERWLKLLEDHALIEIAAQAVQTPPVSSQAHYQLYLLANVVMPTLERLYIVVSLLASDAALTRQELQDQSQTVAHKMARFYGINAPEFFDRRLFNNFVDQLIGDGTLYERDDGTLSHAPIVHDVVRAAGRIIDPELRYAIMRR